MEDVEDAWSDVQSCARPTGTRTDDFEAKGKYENNFYGMLTLKNV